MAIQLGWSLFGRLRFDHLQQHSEQLNTAIATIGHSLQLEGDDILLDYVEHQLHWRQLRRIGCQNSGNLKFFYLDDKILSFISYANIINITNFRDFKSLINVINFIKSNPCLFLLKLAFEFLLKFLQFPPNYLFQYMFLFRKVEYIFNLI